MATIVLDCPHCNSRGMTFDIKAETYLKRGSFNNNLFEIAARCRKCLKMSICVIKTVDSRSSDLFNERRSIAPNDADVSVFFDLIRFVHIADVGAKAVPEELPPEIAKVFEEGVRCLAIGAANAASAMFRLCLDLATKGMLPPIEQQGGPDKHQRRNLAPRLAWLFSTGILPHAMKDLSQAVKDFGDDGAHDGSITVHDAEDVYEFAFVLLERLFTEPARLAAAAKRRDE